MKETLFLVMPTYNEENNIKKVVAEWYPILDYADENSRMIVADGGSTDRTLKILYELQKTYPKLVVEAKPGTDHGTKVIFLYKYAIEHGADWIFQTDTDGQTLPEEFKAFWELRETYNAVIGNRIKRSDGVGRSLVEFILRIYLKIFFGKWVPDANAPFRLMKSNLVEKYIGLFPDNFNLPNAILTECFDKYHEKVIYKEITFRLRQGGVNYMNWKRIMKIGKESIYNFTKIKRNLKNMNIVDEM